MTIPATEPFFSGPYPGNGATVQFDYDFRIYSDDELLVYRRNADLTRTLLDEGTDYAVTGAGAGWAFHCPARAYSDLIVPVPL